MASPPPPASAGAASAAHSVFVYGSLMSEEVVRILLGHVPPSSPALLRNHQRFSIRGRDPAILPVDGNEVSGKVFKEITDWELDVLDTFEAEEYVRETVGVSLTDSSETITALAYVWGNVDDPDLYGEWDYDEWKEVHLKDYLTMTQECKEEMEQLESKAND